MVPVKGWAVVVQNSAAVEEALDGTSPTSLPSSAAPRPFIFLNVVYISYISTIPALKLSVRAILTYRSSTDLEPSLPLMGVFP